MVQKAHVWSEKLDLGHEAIDGEHHLQVAMAGALAEAIEQQRPSMAHRIADQLATYTAAHFEGEQLLMEATAFGGAGEHREEHQTLMAHIEEVRQLLRDGEYALALPMALDLLTGLGSHIAASDRRFAEHAIACRARGRSQGS
jgi:hemerythrin